MRDFMAGSLAQALAHLPIEILCVEACVLKSLAALDFIKLRVFDAEFALPRTLKTAPEFGNHFISVVEDRGSGMDFSNTPLDFSCPLFFNFSSGWRNESRQLARETNSLPRGEAYLRSSDAFVRDNHASDPTSKTG
jgi:hypothetical protein